VAPEVLEGHYDMKCDVWSAGVVLYVLVCGDPPFQGVDTKMIVRQICQGDFNFQYECWKHVSEELKELISVMLVKDPKKRIEL
jgi:calcium-dependent protein kinase